MYEKITFNTNPILFHLIFSGCFIYIIMRSKLEWVEASGKTRCFAVTESALSLIFAVLYIY
ncbi:hypothetical protein AHMF7605_25195 [Adhaeribacter arboris]|uniref:Uncharacterized protein n=1 Tax=Adhaeribacter arboris TaxID=2072846 RepID=A0A2T2YM53_9BACT|nr:hypothetical protein AHMF7605_25195 [Adhaeribacter arboris]